MTAKEIRQDIADLKLAIKSPATPEDKKTLFENKVKELEEKLKAMESKPTPKPEKKDDDFYTAVSKKTGAESKITKEKITPVSKEEKPERKKSVPLKKSEVKDLEYDCDELIEKEKKRKANAKKRAKLPKKSDGDKNREKLIDVWENVRERAEENDITERELEYLISETKRLLKTLTEKLANLKK
jgi:hypothetical protein